MQRGLIRYHTSLVFLLVAMFAMQMGCASDNVNDSSLLNVDGVKCVANVFGHVSPFTGVSRKYFDEQATKLEKMQTYRNGRKDGPFEEYYENGQLKIRGVYKDGRLFVPSTRGR